MIRQAGDLLRRSLTGLLLISAAAAVLLWSDRSKAQHDAAPGRRRIALINYVSVPVLEDGEQGLIDGLRGAGYNQGMDYELVRFNAEGDRSTAILMAKEVVGGGYDMILTLSTPVLQAVATANQQSQRTHVFTLTADPWEAGVGIDPHDHLHHPPYMAGHGSLPPVEAVFRLARRSNPTLQRVGVVWNPAEANSEASTTRARAACKKLGISLIEVTVDTSAGVLEATKALLSKDVQAIWAGGDSTVSAGFATLVKTATESGVPVFTNLPLDVERGSLFSLGADFYEVGRASGMLAGRILDGESPATIPVDNFAPRQLAINEKLLPMFSPTWKFGSDWREKAALVVKP